MTMVDVQHLSRAVSSELARRQRAGHTLDFPLARFLFRDAAAPRVYSGGAYWPSPGLQWIVTKVLPHSRGWRVEFMERWSGSTRRRLHSLGYLDFCSRVRVEP